MLNLNNIKKIFVEKFGDSNGVVVSLAPGRVNLIGDHTDYNGGFVFPMTLDCAIYVAMRRRASADNLCHVYAINLNDEACWSSDRLEKSQEHSWSNYMKGVMDVLQREGYKLGGIEAVVYGNVPIGASLSSSAAIEVATLGALQKLFDIRLSAVDVAKLAQRAENEFVGMRCGIMDQFVSRVGQRDHALFLDCRSLEHKNVPITLDDCGCALLIVDSKVKRELVKSAYNERRASCEAVVQQCQKLYPQVNSLRDVTMPMLLECKASIDQSDATGLNFCRARHVINENQYVLAAIDKLQQKDMVGFGQLLYASHASLRDDYATSCAETDCIVDAARAAGALGARITGAGFGGCVVVVVERQDAIGIQEHIGNIYARAFNITPSFMPLKSNLEATVISL
jgi:galactokinase